MFRQTKAGALSLAALVLLSSGAPAPAVPPATTSAPVTAAGASASTKTSARPRAATPVAGWHIQSSSVATAGGDVISRPDFNPAGWYRVSRRSTVMAGLIQNGRYPADLFYSTNLQRVDRAPFQVPWWYRETIVVAGESQHATLRLDGITSRADVWLNGVQVATAATVAGSHSATEVDVSRVLRAGANGLAIKVQPADANRDFTIGWIDWNPYPPDNNMGIWQDVTLQRTGPIALSGPRVVTKPTPDRRGADIAVKVDVANHATAPVTATVAGAIGDVRFSRAVPLAAGERRTVAFTPADTPQLRFAQVELWWPVGLGEQHLYDLDLTGLAGGQVSDTAATTFGVRDIVSAVDSRGYRHFTVNGKPLLLRGGGWASDMFLRFDARRLDDQLRLTVDLGLNMIRLEGKLEHDELYALADRYGIVLLPGWECCDKWEKYSGWKDADYRISAASMYATATRLRNHPSVVAFLVGSDFAPPTRAENGYLDALKRAEWPNPIVSSASRQSSPSLGSSGMKMDGPYDWVPPNYWYDTRLGAAYGFASELSAGPSVPELDSLRAMMIPAELDRLWREPDAKHYHAAKPGSQFESLRIYNRALAARYGSPTGLEDYVRKAQLANYEAIRAQFEAYGGRRDATGATRTTGLVYWMLNNAWPSLTWHLYDHSLAADAGFYAARKANGAYHVQYAYHDRSVAVVNNSPAPRSGLTVTATVYDLAGTEKFSRTVTGVTVPALGTTRPLTLPAFSDGTHLVKLTTSAGGVETDRNVYWLPARSDELNWDGSTWYHTPVTRYADLTRLTGLARTTVTAAASSRRDSDRTTTTVTLTHSGGGKAPAFFVAATLRRADGKPVLPATWSDNYVTLWPGESITISTTYRTADAGQGAPSVEVAGVNVDRVSVPARR